MKKANLIQRLLIAIVMVPFLANAQNYNHHYGFNWPYQSSVHTCGVQMTNGRIAEGGTLLDPAGGGNVVEIGQVTALPGIMIPSPWIYTTPNNGHDAVDLIESSVTANDVIACSNVGPITWGYNTIGVFKVTPATGVILWTMTLGVNTAMNPYYAAAITSDNTGNYFLLGYTINAAGTRDMYIASFTDAGVMNWESTYTTGVAGDDFLSIDLLYDPNTNEVIATANFTNPAPNGIVVIQVNAATGGLVAAAHVTNIDGTPDFEVKDMSYINNNYVLVGKVNTAPIQGFLLQYMPNLVPFVPFSAIYNVNPPNDIFMTGVKQNNATPTDMNLSFDYTDNMAGGILYPGICEVNATGGIVTSYYYNVPGFLWSRGLIPTGGNVNMVVKSGTNAGSWAGLPALNLVSTVTPQVANPPVLCDNQLPISDHDNAVETPITFMDNSVTTKNGLELLSRKMRGKQFDCNGAYLGPFKLAPTGVEEASAAFGINIYPNPTNGNVTVELGDDVVELYQTAEIYNTLGKVVMTFNVNKSVERIDLSNQVPGIYLLRMKSSDGQVSEAQRIMVK